MASKTEVGLPRIQIQRITAPLGEEPAQLSVPFARGRLISVLTSLTCDANVATRRVALIHRARDIKDFLLSMPSSKIQEENEAFTYNFMAGGDAYVDGNGSQIQIPMPHNGLLLQRFDTIQITTLNVQAGDQFGTSKFLFLVDDD